MEDSLLSATSPIVYVCQRKLSRWRDEAWARQISILSSCSPLRTPGAIYNAENCYLIAGSRASISADCGSPGARCHPQPGMIWWIPLLPGILLAFVIPTPLCAFLVPDTFLKTCSPCRTMTIPPEVSPAAGRQAITEGSAGNTPAGESHLVIPNPDEGHDLHGKLTIKRPNSKSMWIVCHGLCSSSSGSVPSFVSEMLDANTLRWVGDRSSSNNGTTLTGKWLCHRCDLTQHWYCIRLKIHHEVFMLTIGASCPGGRRCTLLLST